MVLPVYWLTGNLTLAYNIAFLASFVSDRAWRLSADARAHRQLLGWVARGSGRVLQRYRFVYTLSHLHVLSIQWFPFALLALHRYFETDERRYLVYTALALLAVNYFSIYYAAYCAPLVIVFAALEMMRFGRWRTLRTWLELWATAAVVAVGSLPLFLPYFEVQRRLGIERSIDDVVRLAAPIDGYQIALPGMTPALIVSAGGLLGSLIDRTSRLRWVVLMLVVLLMLSFWLSLGPIPQAGGQPLGWPAIYAVLYEYVPGYRALRGTRHASSRSSSSSSVCSRAPALPSSNDRWRSMRESSPPSLPSPSCLLLLPVGCRSITHYPQRG